MCTNSIPTVVSPCFSNMPDKIWQTAPPLLCFLQYFGLPGEGGPRKWMWTALVSLMILFFCYHQSYHQSFHMLSSLSSGVSCPLCLFWNRNFTSWAMWRDAHDLGWQTSVFGARLHLASWMIMDAGWRWLKVAEGGWRWLKVAEVVFAKISI